MTDVFLKTGVFFLLVLAVAKPLGVFMARVFEGGKTFLDPVLVPVEKAIYRLAGVDPLRDQGWRQYAGRDARLQRRDARRPLRAPAPPGRPPLLQPGQARRRPAGPRLEHGRLLHDEHELAGLLGRDDDVAPDADGGPRRPQLPLGSDGHRDRRRPRPRHRPRGLEGRSATSGATSCARRCGSSSRSASSRRSS